MSVRRTTTSCLIASAAAGLYAGTELGVFLTIAVVATVVAVVGVGERQERPV